MPRSKWTCGLQLLDPMHLEAVLCCERSHCKEKAESTASKGPLFVARGPRAATRSTRVAMKTQYSQTVNSQIEGRMPMGFTNGI